LHLLLDSTYPYSEKFTQSLPDFVYEEIKEEFGLKLSIVPFDLSDNKSYEQQIHDIIFGLSIIAIAVNFIK